jgi:methionine-S-sulfoxide reductase
MTEKAIFGAGCFWGVEEYFLRLEGVIQTSVGYSGGQSKNPTYREVCGGQTGHAEVVAMEFDPSVIQYSELLQHFWKMHDPSLLNRQGPDVGSQYRSIILTTSPAQKQEADASKKKLIDSGHKVVTGIEELQEYWPAEDYHQQYMRKNPGTGCHVHLPPLKKK